MLFLDTRSLFQYLLQIFATRCQPLWSKLQIITLINLILIDLLLFIKGLNPHWILKLLIFPLYNISLLVLSNLLYYTSVPHSSRPFLHSITFFTKKIYEYVWLNNDAKMRKYYFFKQKLLKFDIKTLIKWW